MTARFCALGYSKKTAERNAACRVLSYGAKSVRNFSITRLSRRCGQKSPNLFLRLTKHRVDCIIFIMLSAVKTSSLIFYSVAAAVALLLAVSFFVALFRKRHKRGAADVLGIVFFTLVMAAAAITAAATFTARYGLSGLSVTCADGIFSLLYDGKRLFSVPYLGYYVDIFVSEGLLGIIIPPAEFALALAAAIAAGVKSRADKRAFTGAKEPESISDNDTRISEDGGAADGENAFGEEDSAEDAPYSDDKAVEDAAYDIDSDEGVISSDAARNIVDEIDMLVTGSDGVDKGGSVDDELLRAIREGYAIRDSIENASEDALDYPEDFSGDEETPVGDVYSELYDAVDAASEEFTEEQTDETLDSEVTPEIVHSTRKRAMPDPEDVIPVEGEKIPAERIRKVEPGEYNDAMGKTRVRTIIRRPAAKDLTDIERRAEEVLKEDKTETSDKKQKQADKQVTAQQGGLPLTRKYIILNRRNAAAVFNDYLNSKREREKEEITGSLNTIIMK